MHGTIDKSLSQSELERLEAVLDRPESLMVLEEAHGFLTAIVSAPSMLPPSTWLQSMLGDEPPIHDAQEAQEVLGLIMRLYNEIISELRAGAFQPFGYPDEWAIERWCQGYLEGVRLDDVWRSDEYALALLFPMGILSGEFDLEGEIDADGQKITDPTKHIAACRDQLPECVQKTYDYFVDQRRADAPSAARAKTKVGRNDPCPCGSGKKYKACCLKAVVH